MGDVTSRLTSLSKGFREQYLDYDALTEQLQIWQRAFPDWLRLESLGETPEGRQLWLAVLGREPERLRPALWIDGNMHAAELCGSSVALAWIEALLELFLSGNSEPLGVPESVRRVVAEGLFYVLPRMSPDGAEMVLKTGRVVRSVPRDTRLDTGRPRWRARDLDGDGQILMLRYRDDAGEFIESSEEPGLMLRRQIDDPGPYYQLAVEGTIEHFDGVTVPAPGAFDDHFPDLNRNFPWSWAPEPEQEGAGAFPTSEPESRAVVEFATRHPNIFAWGNYHTFGGVYIRPLGHAPDVEMNASDLSLYNQFAVWAAEHTGYPTVSGFHEFTYSPNQPLRGDIVDFAYHQRGTFAYTCELWDLFRQLGLEKPSRFAESYVRLGRAEHKKLWHWDREHNDSRIFRPWKLVEHPELGQVDVGGVDPRIGVWNPPEQRLPELCRSQVELMFRVAALAPQLRLTCVERTPLGDGVWAAKVVIENLGYLPTYVLESARRGALGECPRLELEPTGCTLTSPARSSFEIEHLLGWGRGAFSLQSSLLSTRSAGSASKTCVSFSVRGGGSVRVRVSSPRLGTLETIVVAPAE
ncbi:MAG TPA: M14 family metallopeptidase [Polyangiaceae bacterium]|nr:M14 family metallopeptidase [Polyangiaceae bacterium]